MTLDFRQINLIDSRNRISSFYFERVFDLDRQMFETIMNVTLVKNGIIKGCTSLPRQ